MSAQWLLAVLSKWPLLIVLFDNNSAGNCSSDIPVTILLPPSSETQQAGPHMIYTCMFRINKILVWFMVFNATFNNISVLSWRSVLFVEETGVPGKNH
jgi:hypothetical protein